MKEEYMSQDKKSQDYINSLVNTIQSFKTFDDNFAPFSTEEITENFKYNREPGWSVFKRAIFVMNKNGNVMMFYRPPLGTKEDGKILPKGASSTYEMASHNSIVVYDEGSINFQELAEKRIQGWPKDTRLIPAGMGYSRVAGYHYFFEVSYAVVPNSCNFTINGIEANFIELSDAISLMDCHGLESKEMEINIAKTLCKK